MGEQLELGGVASTPKGRPRLQLRRAVESSIGAAPWVDEMDAAACQLAVTVATRLDRETDPATWNRTAPLLLSSLEALGLTPKARKAITRTSDDPFDALVASFGSGPVRDGA